MAAEHGGGNAGEWMWLADKVWAIVSATVLGLVAWVLRHESRMTKLEAQHEASESARREAGERLDAMDSKLDKILWHLMGQRDGH